MKKALLAISFLLVFSAGYIMGSINTRDAIAFELGTLTGASGTVESLKNLGKTVIEMQENVNKLQKNIDGVKKAKDDITNYQGLYNKVMGVPAPAPTPAPQKQPAQDSLEKGLQNLLK